MLPERGGVTPMMLRSVVVLPAPFLPEEHHQLALRHVEGQSEEHVARLVIRVEILDLEDQPVSPR